MTLDWPFYLIAVASSLLLLARTARRGRAHAPAWAAKGVLVLAIAAASYRWCPGHGYWLTIASWFALIAAPSLLVSLALRDSARSRYGVARRYAWAASLLHPFDGLRFMPAVMGALDLAERDGSDQGRAALSRQLADPRIPRQLRPLLRAHLARLDGSWDKMLAESGDDPSSDALQFRLRALGETGRLPEMVAAFARSRSRHEAPNPSAQLVLLAFCGRVAGVSAVLDGPLSPLSRDAKAFWLATAELAAGDTQQGHRRLTEVMERAGQGLRRSAERRLHAPLRDPATALAPGHWRVIAALEGELRDDAPYRARVSGGWRRSIGIAVLVALNLIVYAAGLALDASGHQDALLDLGAMRPDAVVVDGEWWRLATALFLHINVVHVTFNMLALVVLGPWVEWMVGHARVLVIYLAAGFGSTAGVLLLIEVGWMPAEALVGASGAIFGLVGAQTVLFAQGWRRLRSRLAVQRLRMLGAIILMQTVFDLLTPEVSWSAHLWGLAVGAAVTAVLTIGRVRAPGAVASPEADGS
jgi:rhomboid protease GluP